MQLPISTIKWWIKLDKAYLNGLARRGDVAAIRQILNHREPLQLNLDAQDRDGYTALCLAIIYGHWPCSLLLLEAGANPYIRDSKGDSIFHTFITAERLEVLQFFLWHRPDPEDYRSTLNDHDETAASRIDAWNVQQPGIKQRLADTVKSIQAYRQALEQAENQLAHILYLSVEQQELAYMQVARKLRKAANIQYDARQEIVNNAEVKEKWPSSYETIRRYHAQQALALYQKILTVCYHQREPVNPSFLQRIRYIELLMRLASLCIDLDQVQMAKGHYHQATEQCLRSMQAIRDVQATPLKQLAIECYTQYEALLQPKANDQDIEVLHQAAQWYMQLAMQTEEERYTYIEKAHRLYQRLAQLCQGLKKEEKKQAYLEHAHRLEVQYLTAQTVPSSAERAGLSTFPEGLATLGLHRRPSWKRQAPEQKPLLRIDSNSEDEEDPVLSLNYSNRLS